MSLLRSVHKSAKQLCRCSSTLASSAYVAPQPSAAATSTPNDLTPKQRQIIERIIRVDQAGEIGANWIYKGQVAVFRSQGKTELANLIQVRLGSFAVPMSTADCSSSTAHVGR